MTLRIGFYGAGLISGLHRAFLAASGVDHDIVAIHDPDNERASAFAATSGAQVVSEDRLLDLVDAIYITTWTSEHPRLVENAAQRSVAVFCEKPLGVDARTVEQMIGVVRDARIVNQVGLILRNVPPILHLRRLLDDPRAGRVLTVVFRDDQYIPNQGRYASTWRMDPALAGRGALLEHSIHDVDILRWLLGPVAAVRASVREFHGYERIDDLAVAHLEFESGAIATLTSVWHDILERPSMRRIEVFCERLYVGIDGDLGGPIGWQFTGEDAQSLDGHALVEHVVANHDPDGRVMSPFLGGAAFNSATDFLGAVRDDRPAYPDFAEALTAHRLVDAIYASADAGGATVHDPERGADVT
jgi:predicted dehydrogenase